jgi:DNA mismatch endonuclease (patch repair protein)
MADVFSVSKRSEIMSRVKGRGNKATELRLIKIFRAYAIKGWRQRANIFGKPDFVFPRERLAVFVDGCFWHGCPIHGSIPISNRAFWRKKLSRNRQRDKLVCQRLRQLGFRVLRIWQHELASPDTVACTVNKRLLRRESGGIHGRRKKN